MEVAAASQISDQSAVVASHQQFKQEEAINISTKTTTKTEISGLRIVDARLFSESGKLENMADLSPNVIVSPLPQSNPSSKHSTKHLSISPTGHQSITLESESSHSETSVLTTQNVQFEEEQENQLGVDNVQANDVEVQALLEETQAPIEETQTSVEETQTSVEETQAPVEETQAPVEETQATVEETQDPSEVTQTPVEETQAPAEITQTPVEETQALAEETESPVEETPAPAEEIQISAKETEVPTEETVEKVQSSVEQAQSTVQEVETSNDSVGNIIENYSSSPQEEPSVEHTTSPAEVAPEITLQNEEVVEIKVETDLTSSVLKPYDQIGEIKPEGNCEIEEENLRSQLNEIIQEIDFEVAMDEDGPTHHTWQPRGEYALEKTEITHEDVVAEVVPDVSITTKVATPVPEEKPDSDQNVMLRTKLEGSDTGSNLQGTKRPTSTKVLRNSLTNGDNVDLMEIPIGIPLLAKILPKEDDDEEREKIPLERLFTPATDWEEIVPQKKKQFSSSAFYGSDHPTIDDQVELAHKISVSLIDDNNKKSRGQSMYIKRKNKSSKWIHDAVEYDEDESRPAKERPQLKLAMKSNLSQEFNSVQQNYEEILSSSQTLQQISGIELGKEISTNLQSPTGKGAALFAKRKKRMDKFIVDETTMQQQQQQQQSSTVVYEATSTASTTTVNVQTKQEQNISQEQQQTSIQSSAASQSGLKLPDLTNILTKPVPPQKKIPNLEARGVKGQKPQELKKQGFQPQSFPTPPARKIKTVQKPQTIPKYNNASVSAVESNNLYNGLDTYSPPDPLTSIRPGSPPVFMNTTEQHMQSSLSSTVQSDLSNETTNINDDGTIYTAEVKLVQQAASPPSTIINFQAPQSHSVVMTELTTDEEAEKIKSFNLAPKGWGTYNNFYTPVHLGAR